MQSFELLVNCCTFRQFLWRDVRTISKPWKSRISKRAITSLCYNFTTCLCLIFNVQGCDYWTSYFIVGPPLAHLTLFTIYWPVLHFILNYTLPPNDVHICHKLLKLPVTGEDFHSCETWFRALIVWIIWIHNTSSCVRNPRSALLYSDSMLCFCEGKH